MLDFAKAKPREIEGYLRQAILRAHGDAAENKSSITASRGYYSVSLFLPKDQYAEFHNFRKQDAPRIAKAIRALKA